MERTAIAIRKERDDNELENGLVTLIGTTDRDFWGCVSSYGHKMRYDGMLGSEVDCGRRPWASQVVDRVRRQMRDTESSRD